MEAIQGIKIFEVSEGEYVAAATAEDAVRWLGETHSMDADQLKAEGLLDEEGPRELAESELEKTLRDEDEPDFRCTFREALIEQTQCSCDFPDFFASNNI